MYENHIEYKKLTKILFRTEQVLVFGAILLLLIGFLINKIFVLQIDGVRLLLIYGFVVVIVHFMVFASAVLKYRDLAKCGKPLPLYPSRQLPVVSCMVAVHNEEHFIERCLDAIYSQTYPKKEVIVVNDASTDKTLEVLRNYKKNVHPDLKIINLRTNIGKKAALCKAMREAKGSIYAHTDSDSIWQSTALARVVRIFVNNPDVGAVSGHGRAYNSNKNFLTRMQDSWMEGQFSIRKAFESSYGCVTCVSGPLAVFRREAVYNLLPRWERDRFLGAEFRFATDRTLTALVLGSHYYHKRTLKQHHDSEFLQEIHPPKHLKVVYSRSARSETIVPESFRSFLKQQARWKKSFIRNVFFNSPFFWRKPAPVAFVFYAHIIFVFLAPIIVFSVFFLPHQNHLAVILFYLSSVAIVGTLFGVALRLEDKTCKYWYYRPLMSLTSSLILSWLIFYSLFTIRKMQWHRG